MTTLIRKELRENFVVAVVAFAIFAFWMTEVYHNASISSQPLLALSGASVLCGVLGAVLGWLQIHNERHRDLWAFLIHRPLPRGRIFLAKVIAGLCLYSLGAGLPFIGLLVMVRIPGHVAAPFEWAMMLPYATFLLSGVVYYFGGMLTGLRQARWYVSRGLGLGVGIAVSAAMFEVPEFWRALILILMGGTIAAVAAWGSFMSHGYYRGQPAWSRRVLPVPLMAGCGVVVFVGMALLGTLLPQPTQHLDLSRYGITKSGSIYIVKGLHGKPQELTDLNGMPLKDAKTGRPVTDGDASTNLDYRPYTCGIRPVYYEYPAQYQNSFQRSYLDASHYFLDESRTLDTLWYWTWSGRFLAYNGATRRFVGSLGPDGFNPGEAAGRERFSRTQDGIGMTDTAVYRVDLEKRTASVLFVATNDDRIGGVNLAGHQDSAIVVTKRSVQMLTPEGKPVWQIPYEPGYPIYPNVDVSFLEPSNLFAVWFSPSYQSNRVMNWTLPTRVVWVTAGQRVLVSTNLPALPIRVEWTGLWGKEMFNAVQPPALYFIQPLLDGKPPFYTNMMWDEVRSSLVVGTVCAVVGWILGRRYRFGVGAQVKWAGFHLLFGVPGLLAFLCVQEWPARETCPNCKKPRLVDREQCEYCGAAWAPPPKNGIEIFETIGAMPRPPG